MWQCWHCDTRFSETEIICPNCEAPALFGDEEDSTQHSAQQVVYEATPEIETPYTRWPFHLGFVFGFAVMIVGAVTFFRSPKPAEFRTAFILLLAAPILGLFWSVLFGLSYYVFFDVLLRGLFGRSAPNLSEAELDEIESLTSEMKKRPANSTSIAEQRGAQSSQDLTDPPSVINE